MWQVSWIRGRICGIGWKIYGSVSKDWQSSWYQAIGLMGLPKGVNECLGSEEG